MDYSLGLLGVDILRLQVPNIDIARNILSLVEDKYIHDMKTYWQSKYDDYVAYDYEPFASEGFYVRIDLKFKSVYDMRYSKFLIEKFLANIDLLERCLNTDLILDKEEK